MATELTHTAVYIQGLVPMFEQTTLNGSTGGQFLADAGYCSQENLEHTGRIEAGEKGTEFFIATGRLKHGEQMPDAPRGPIPKTATVKQRMARTLKMKKGRAAYARRNTIVEPVFGQIDNRQGKHLLLRGLEHIQHEWNLMAASHNLLKLFRFQAQTAPARA